MRRALGLAGFGLALLLGIVPVPASVAAAQVAATETGKRKVQAKIAPDYPPLAKEMNVAGKVKIEATVAADGHVESTRVVGGSPLLVNAALDALKKWRFEAGPKETMEMVEFQFSAPS